MKGWFSLLAVCGLLLQSFASPGAPAPATKEEVRRCIAQLEDPDPLVRQDAADALGRLGPAAADAVPALQHALNDIRTVGPAAEALAAIGPAAVPALVEAFKADGVWSGRAASDALVKLGPAAVPALVEILRDPNAGDHQTEVIDLLGRIGPPAAEAIPTLVERLKDRDLVPELDTAGPRKEVPVVLVKDQAFTVRLSAALALGRMGPRAVPVLIELSRKRPRIRWDSLVTLVVRCWFLLSEDVGGQTSGGRLALVCLRMAFDAPRLFDSVMDHDPIVRGLAADALGDAKPGKAVVSALVAALADPCPAVRIEAAGALGRLDPDARTAVPTLLRALQDERVAADDALSASFEMHQPKSVRAAAVSALLALGPEAKRRLLREGLPVLLSGLRSPRRAARESAIEALDPLGPEAKAAAPALAESLRESSGPADAWAGVALLQGMEADAVPHLVSLLKARTPQVRARAAGALAAVGRYDPTIIPALVEALRDENKDVRLHAVEALGTMGPKARKALPALRAALRDTDAHVCLAAVRAVPQVGGGSREPAAALVRLLRHPDFVVRCETLDAMSRFGAPPLDAVPILEQLARRGVSVSERVPAVGLLGRLSPKKAEDSARRIAEVVSRGSAAGASQGVFGDLGQAARVAVPLLRAGLRQHHGQRDFSMRWEVIAALGDIGPDAAAAVPEMLEGLEDDVGCEVTANALGRIGPGARAAVPALTVALRNPNGQVRIAAVTALGKIGPAAKAAVPRLRRLLRSQRGADRVWAACALLRITRDEKTYLPVLTEVLRGGAKGADGQREALKALEALTPAGQELVPGVAELLSAADPVLRSWAADVLGKMGPEASGVIPRLVERLRDGEVVYVRVAAARALGRIRLGAGRPAVVRRLEELARDGDADESAAATEALLKIRLLFP